MTCINLRGDTLHVLLVRHGESESNVALHQANAGIITDKEDGVQHERYQQQYQNDAPLTPLGHQQGVETGAYIARLIEANHAQWGREVMVCTSPLTRASYTAAHILASLQLNGIVPLIVDEVVPDAVLQTVHDDLVEYRRGEGDCPTEKAASRNFVCFQMRVNRLFQVLERVPTEKTRLAIIVGHSLFFSQFISNIVGTHLDAHGHPGGFVNHLPNCSISHVVYSPDTGVWSVLNMSQTAHLSQPTGMHFVPCK